MLITGTINLGNNRQHKAAATRALIAYDAFSLRTYAAASQPTSVRASGHAQQKKMEMTAATLAICVNGPAPAASSSSSSSAHQDSRCSSNSSRKSCYCCASPVVVSSPSSEGFFFLLLAALFLVSVKIYNPTSLEAAITMVSLDSKFHGFLPLGGDFQANTRADPTGVYSPVDACANPDSNRTGERKVSDIYNLLGPIGWQLRSQKGKGAWMDGMHDCLHPL